MHGTKKKHKKRRKTKKRANVWLEKQLHMLVYGYVHSTKWRWNAEDRGGKEGEESCERTISATVTQGAMLFWEKC